jgi:hypothetical protein
MHTDTHQADVTCQIPNPEPALHPILSTPDPNTTDTHTYLVLQLRLRMPTNSLYPLTAAPTSALTQCDTKLLAKACSTLTHHLLLHTRMQPLNTAPPPNVTQHELDHTHGTHSLHAPCPFVVGTPALVLCMNSCSFHPPGPPVALEDAHHSACGPGCPRTSRLTAAAAHGVRGLYRLWTLCVCFLGGGAGQGDKWGGG